MTGLTFIQDLAIVMAVCAATTILCHKIRLPAVLGYILAGILIGPHTPPFSLVHDAHSIETLADLGVIFLMFSIGLEFNLKKLRRLGLTAFFATTLEVLLMICIGFSVGKMLGWRFMDCLFLGAILSISSTTIIATVLIQLKLIRERFAQIVIAVLIMEDLLAILIIATLSALSITGSVNVQSISFSALKVAVFILLSIGLGLVVLPRFIHYVSRSYPGEVLIVTLLGLCFGFSILGAQLGFSIALGAFLIGAVIAESKEIEEIVRKIEPLRDMFIALFFVSVGMFLDLDQVRAGWFPILVITLAVILGKHSCVSFAVFLTGHPAQTALKAGLAMTQIGEFSFIIARLGETSGVTEHSLFPIAVSVSFLASFLTPIFIRQGDALSTALAKWVPRPIATFGEFYTSWLSRLWTEKGHQVALEELTPSQIWKRAKNDLSMVAVYLFLIAALFALSLQFESKLLLKIPGPLPPWISGKVLYWLLIGLVIFPFWVGLVYSLDKALWDIFFVSPQLRKKSEEEVREPRQVLRNMFRLGILVGLSLAVIAVGFPFLPHVPLLLVAGAFLSLASLWFWNSVTRLHAYLNDTLRVVFEKEEPGAKKIEMEKARHDLEELIKKEYPWEVQTEDLLIPYRQTAVNRAIRDLELPQLTGAMIMAIYREEGVVVNPSPDTVVMPGDVLVLMGEKEQIQKAMRYLHELMSKPPSQAMQEKPEALRLTVSPGSQAVEKTLSELSLRAKTGVTVIGLQRLDGTTITNPSPSTQLLAGDTVILFGTRDQIVRAREILGSSLET